MNVYTVNFFTTSSQLAGTAGTFSTGSYSSLETDTSGLITTVYYTNGSDAICGIARAMNVTVTCSGAESVSCGGGPYCSYWMQWATPLACPGGWRGRRRCSMLYVVQCVAYTASGSR